MEKQAGSLLDCLLTISIGLCYLQLINMAVHKKGTMPGYYQ